MALLTRDQILQAQDIETMTVHVPEWGGSVAVRGMTGRERDRFEESLVEERKGKRKMNLSEFRAKVCALCIVNEKGEREFTDRDIAALGDKSGAALARVYNVAAALSGLSDEDVNELLGNSDDGQPGDSLSA